LPVSAIVRLNFGIVTRRVPLVEQELLTSLQHPSSSPVCSGYRVTLTLDLCVMFLKSLFVLLSFFVWSLCCLSFYDLRIFITPLISSNSWYFWGFFCLCFVFRFIDPSIRLIINYYIHQNHPSSLLSIRQ
jgi:hypothetical protein